MTAEVRRQNVDGQSTLRGYALRIATAEIVVVAWLAAAAHSQTLSRGQEILQQKGLQIQAMIVPDRFDSGLSASRFAESNFSAVNLNSFDRSINLDKYLGSAPGLPMGLWYNNGQPVLNDKEQPYLPNMVSLQFHDELDISQPSVLNESKTVLASWRTLYPNVIGYLNHISGNTDAQLQNYLSYSQPDMVMFATYPFNGSNAGGSPTELYVDMQRFRKLGLAGHDGTGNHPIPYALYLQTFTWDILNDHYPSASEMRLNQFAAWAFGYTYATAFMYTDIPNESDFQAALFVGSGDAMPRQPAFSDIAETNRQSRNLGDALVRLQSTDVGMVMGQHRLQFGQFEFIVDNTLPNGIDSWSSASDDDPYLIGVSSQNVGSVNNGLRGDVVVGQFRPMQGAVDPYFMIVNGLSAISGTVADASQTIHLSFDFGASGINSLLRLSRNTGFVETVPLVHQGGSQYTLDLTLEGGTGDLFKYNNGIPFVSAAPQLPGDYDGNGEVGPEDYDVWQSTFGSTSELDADGDNSGVIDAADFTVWRDNFDSSSGAIAITPTKNFGTSNVPEPGVRILMTSCLIAFGLRRMQRRNR